MLNYIRRLFADFFVFRPTINQSKTDGNRKRLVGNMRVLLAFNVLFIFIYAFGFKTGAALVIGILSLIAAASGMSGFFLGFLFGIPKPKDNKKDSNGDANKPQADYESSNSLNEIADWLTKIIVGLGLIELSHIPPMIQSVGVYVEMHLHHCIGSCAGSLIVFTNSLIIYNGILGVYLGYNYARIVLAPQYKDTDEELRVYKTEVDSRNAANPDIVKELAKKQEILSNNDLRLTGKTEGIQELVKPKILDSESFRKLLEAAKERMDKGLVRDAKLAESDKDPQKDQWGGKNEMNHRRMSASVVPLIDSSYLFKVTIIVESTNIINYPLIDGTPVLFALHNTYANPFKLVTAKDDVASLELIVYGAFTVGAFVNDINTVLEYDLSTIPGAPKEFKER